MHKKINVDYIRNKLDKLPQVQLPQVQIPKIKSRKIFHAKNGGNNNPPPPLPKVPPPTVVDRSPVTISTISQLVDGAPVYDYSFGGAQVSDEMMARFERDEEQIKTEEKPPKGNKTFSEKLTKHYKEFSEFKFKNILGKKTVVKTTVIEVDEYKQRYEEELRERRSDNSDYDFELDSTPSVSANTSRRGSETKSLLRRNTFAEIPPMQSESLSNLEELEEVPPNDSSLYRIKERADMSGSTYAMSTHGSPEEEQDNETEVATPAENPKRSHRQMFDNACGRAKKAVNSKLKKLKKITTKNQDQQSAQQEGAPPKVPKRKSTYKKRTDVPVPRMDSADSARSEQESLDSFARDTSLDLEPPRPEWVAKRIFSTEPKETPRCLKSQYSMDSYESEREMIATRPAPPPPVPRGMQQQQQNWSRSPTPPISDPKIQSPPADEWDEPESPLLLPKVKQPALDEWGPPPPIPSQTVVIFHKLASPAQTKGAVIAELPKGHLRKPSMDSIDSDSWIPETYRNAPRPQIGLNKIDESDGEPWSMQVAMPGRAQEICNAKKLAKTKSIDIFATKEGERIFEDFDDALKNVPVIPISIESDDEEPLQPDPPTQIHRPTKPLVKQTSLSRQFSDEIEVENLAIDVNKLITQFEPASTIQETEQVHVMKNMRKAKLQCPEASSPAKPLPHKIEPVQLPPQPEPLQENSENVQVPVSQAPVPNPCGESIIVARSRRISAKEWATLARATRSLDSGANQSEEIFYSFEKEQHDVIQFSPQQMVIRRQVYRIDL